MIPYRPIPPLTTDTRKGWKAVISAVVMAALLGTTAPAAVAAESGSGTVSATIAAQAVATEPGRRES